MRLNVVSQVVAYVSSAVGMVDHALLNMSTAPSVTVTALVHQLSSSDWVLTKVYIIHAYINANPCNLKQNITSQNETK
jgi:hypothetical protein